MGNIIQIIAKYINCCKKVRPPNRSVYINNKHPPGEVYVAEKFPNNRITTSKYTAWNFLFLNLFEQFQRVANFYFLCIAFIEVVIDSPVSPVTSIVPLVFVITVTAIKQGYEDWLRHQADNEVNNRACWVVRNGELQEIKSHEIVVGDVLRVQMNHPLPCDLVMMSSHDPDGECYITTANLDGETNLKTFYCVPETRHLQTSDTFESFRGIIECQQPITDLYKFVGRIEIQDGDEKTVKSLCHENVLLRGARLKNTPFIYGCAVYTGKDTKMSLNSKFKSHKFSRVERSMNKFLLIFLLLLCIESGLLVGLKRWYISQPGGQPWYVLGEHSLTALVFIEEFLSFMVLLNYIIPISMYVTVELMKFFGSMLLGWDLELYDSEVNERAKANTSDLNEELGQVEYLFSDKTGTLTENDMQFRQCSIGGVKYIEVGGMLCFKPDIPDVQPAPVPQLTSEMEEFLMVLSLCHTVRVDKKDNTAIGSYSETGFEYEYQAPSPDEKAFIEACRRYGVVLHGMKDDYVEVSFNGEMRRYEPLHILEFDANRKRMSVIIRDQSGEVYLLCKGAEATMLPRATGGDKDTILRHVNDYAVLGLRTLVIGIRRFTVEEFRYYDKILQDSRKSLEHREEKLVEAFSAIEQNLTLLGATAVEDRLQAGVPETIAALRTAGIKIWVLTGDKEETAVNISYSAGHFFQGVVELPITRQTSSEMCGNTIAQHRKTLQSRNCNNNEIKHALIVDGASLTYALSDHSAIFRDVCQACSTVLCCRMSPLQKAEVVRLIKKSSASPVTAAIGDGANDVSMIQEAHVGLGIMGKEGRQAVRCSDYAFPKFQCLQRALLVHGHYYYVRIAYLVQYFFYKNIAFITAQFYYAFFSAFSAQSLFDSYFLMFFNLAFTSLPILIYGLFEQNIPQDVLLQHPSLYKDISKNARLSYGQFIKYNILGYWHSAVFFFGSLLMFQFTPIHSDSTMAGNWMLGVMVYTTCVITVNIKLCLETYYWTGITAAALAISAIFYIAGTSIYSVVIWPSLFVDQQNMLGVWHKMLSSPTVWLGLLLLVVMALIPDIVLVAMGNTSSSVNHLRQSGINKVKFYETNKLSISFTKRSGKLTISTTNIMDAE